MGAYAIINETISTLCEEYIKTQIECIPGPSARLQKNKRDSIAGLLYAEIEIQKILVELGIYNNREKLSAEDSKKHKPLLDKIEEIVKKDEIRVYETKRKEMGER